MMKSNIHDYIQCGRSAHLVGIGGVSMSVLAEVLVGMGMRVTGSDLNDSAAAEHLRGLGVPVAIGHGAGNVGAVDVVIRTAAVHDDNPEIAAARAQGIPVFERAQAWGSIMRRYENALCIAGTHGKTTTTSMCTHIFMAAGRDPTVMIGGTLNMLGSGYRVGGGDTIILESCEYCNSFLSFFPTVAVILNVEADHLDFFHDLEEVQHSFRTFAELVPQDGGVIVANGEDENTMAALAGTTRSVCTFGLERGMVHTAGLVWKDGLPSFDVMYRGRRYAHIVLAVPGEHNVKNAVAAAACAIVLGLPGSAVEAGLAAFHGAGRRFEFKGEYNGARVYDDYAHHPGELRALLKSAKYLGYRRIICAFQPHTYTRTAALFDDFVQELSKADVVLLAEIYAAREVNTVGISSRQLAEKISGALYFQTLPELTDWLRVHVQPGDLVLAVGAGDIYQVADGLVQSPPPGEGVQ